MDLMDIGWKLGLFGGYLVGFWRVLGRFWTAQARFDGFWMYVWMVFGWICEGWGEILDGCVMDVSWILGCVWMDLDHP